MNMNQNIQSKFMNFKLMAKYYEIESKHQGMLSAIFIILASLIYSIASSLSKCLPHISGSMLTYYKCMTVIIINELFITKSKKNQSINKQIQFKLILLGVSSCLGAVCFMHSVKFIFITESVILYSLSGIWTAICSVFIFKIEKPTMMLFLAIILSFSGIVIIVNPPFLHAQQDILYDPQKMHGQILALLSSIFFSYFYQMLNKISQKTSQLNIMLYVNITGIAIAPVFCIIHNQWKLFSYEELKYTLMFCAILYIANVFLQKSLQLGSALSVTILGYSEIIFAQIIDIVWFDAQFSLMLLLGLIVVLFGFILLGLNGQQNK